jgi:hypothetical protein
MIVPRAALEFECLVAGGPFSRAHARAGEDGYPPPSTR